MTFAERVLEVVKSIPRGQIMTYGQVAEVAGSPRAWRAVGNILNKNTDPAIPCHRVIKSSGEVGGYRLGSEKKRKLLKLEGAVT